MPDPAAEARAEAEGLLKAAWDRAVRSGKLPDDAVLSGETVLCTNPEFGDFAAKHAIVSAGSAHMTPEELSRLLLSFLDLSGSSFSRAEAAKFGFLNFRLSDEWYLRVLEQMAQSSPHFGRMLVAEPVTAPPPDSADPYYEAEYTLRRIESLLPRYSPEGPVPPPEGEIRRALIRSLAFFPQAKGPEYLRTLARMFHEYYHRMPLHRAGAQLPLDYQIYQRTAEVLKTALGRSEVF